jgi:hypothetical protein
VKASRIEDVPRPETDRMRVRPLPEYLKFEVLNEVQQTLFIDRNSAKSGLTATTDLEGQKLKRFVDTHLYKSAMDRVVRAVAFGSTSANVLPSRSVR